jgi:hypothetical protein
MGCYNTISIDIPNLPEGRYILNIDNEINFSFTKLLYRSLFQSQNGVSITSGGNTSYIEINPFFKNSDKRKPIKTLTLNLIQIESFNNDDKKNYTLNDYKLVYNKYYPNGRICDRNPCYSSRINLIEFS